MDNLAILREIFGKRLVVTIDEVAPILGWHPQSIRNAIARGTWQIRVLRLGGSPCMTVVDVAAHLNGDQSPLAPTPAVAVDRPATQPKREPGRPKKSKLGAGGSHGRA